MKKILPVLAVALLGTLMFHSCNKEAQTGKLKFGLDLTEEATLKSAADGEDVVAALVTIVNENGTVEYDKEYLELIRFGDQYVTRALDISVGVHWLSEFMLVNAEGEVVWATPMEGSELAHLVNRPLPVRFDIKPGETTPLEMEVVRTEGYTPGDFGYAEFKIHFVNRFCLKVFMDCYGIDDILYDTTPMYDAAGMPIYQPRLVISVNDRQLLEEYLAGGVNRFSVPICEGIYRVMAFGYRGEVIFEQEFGLEELMKFRCDPDYPPLYIPCQPGPGIIITPEGLHEPTIEQGVFGRILSPPTDSIVVRENELYPVMREVWFFPYQMTDSLFINGPVDCYFPAGMIWQEPVAVVRSNSDGFFQVGLDTGQYLYLVRTDRGFFIANLELSSVPPGSVTVHSHEVSKIYIQLIDCSIWY